MWSYIQLYKCTKATLVFNPKGKFNPHLCTVETEQ